MPWDQLAYEREWEKDWEAYCDRRDAPKAPADWYDDDYDDHNFIDQEERKND